MNYLKGTVTLGLLVGLLGVSQAGWACYLWGPHAGGLFNSYTLPPTPLIIDKGASTGPVGNVIQIDAGSTFASLGMVAVCYFYIRYATPMSDSGYERGVYKTNIPGIGFKVYERLHNRAFLNEWTNWVTQDYRSHVNSSTGVGFSNFLRLQFYITGPVSPGEINFSATVQARIQVNTIYHTLTINGTVPVIRGGCRTPDIRVDLKRHSSASFPKLWATSPETPFDFQLNECEPGMNAVSYTFKPATGVTLTHPGNATYQWLTLSSSSTAKGVAVQVMNADGSMVKFNQKIKFTGYNKATGGSYRIPMKARYMRTGNITNGTANSAMEFIMHYE